MNAFAETSFLLSVAGDDTHTARATGFLSSRPLFMVTTGLTLFECRNRVHKWQLASAVPQADARQLRHRLDTLVSRHFLHVREVTLRRLAAEALRMIEIHSPGLPHGTMDVIHVAAAVALRCDSFCTFDKNQRALALAAGLRVLPT
jgi:predicted nucleic acid-binding protein